jgi:FtsH-binding integral membrane protein
MCGTLIYSNLTDVFLLLNSTNCKKALHKLAYNEWLLNPNAYFTASGLSHLASWVGYLLFLFLGFFSMAALKKIALNPYSTMHIVMQLALLCNIGLLFCANARMCGFIDKRISCEDIGSQNVLELWTYGSTPITRKRRLSDVYIWIGLALIISAFAALGLAMI